MVELSPVTAEDLDSPLDRGDVIGLLPERRQHLLDFIDGDAVLCSGGRGPAGVADHQLGGRESLYDLLIVMGLLAKEVQERKPAAGEERGDISVHALVGERHPAQSRPFFAFA